MCIRRHGYEHNIRVYIYTHTLIHAFLHTYIYIYVCVWNKTKGSLEVKLPTIWTEVGRVREEKKKDQRRERVRGKKMQMREKVEKSRFTVFFQWCVCGSGGSKSRLAKAARAEPSGQMRDEKLHAVVARSTYRSQNVQKTPCSDHFWTFKCRFAWQAQGIVHLVKS